MSEPPEPIQEEPQGPMGDPPQEIEQMKAFLLEEEPAEEQQPEPAIEGSRFSVLYSDLLDLLSKGPAAADGLLLDPSTAAPGAVVEVEVAAGTHGAVAGDGVELPMEFPPAAATEVDGQGQQHAPADAPFVLGLEVPEMHGPLAGDAEVEDQMMLDPAAAAVATEVDRQQHAPAVAPFVLGLEVPEMHGPLTGDAELEDLMMLRPAAAAAARQMAPRRVLAQEATQTGKAEMRQEEEDNMQHDFRAPLLSYSETNVIHLIIQNKWDDLQSYLLSYMPQDGTDLTMEHAHLFLCCRKSKLLTILTNDCDIIKAEAYLKNSILPLVAARSKYVNSVQINKEILSIHDCLNQRRSMTNHGAEDYIKDYMDFHFPDQTRFNHGRTEAWRFVSKVQGECSKGKTTVWARCKLCQNRIPTKNSPRNLVLSHIGGMKCPNITSFAQDLYRSKILGEQIEQKMSSSKELKRPGDDVLESDLKSPWKMRRLHTPDVILGRTQGSSLLKDINDYVDDVSSSVNDLWLMTNPQNKAIVKRRIDSTLAKIKESVTLMEAQTAASTMADVTVPHFESNEATDVIGVGASAQATTTQLAPEIPQNFPPSDPMENIPGNVSDTQEYDEVHH